MAIQGRAILITGASSGLGRGMALALSHGGNQLVVTARRESLLRELATEVEANGSRCLVVAADAVCPDGAQAVVDAALSAFGRVDVAVLNAGGGVATDMAEADSAAVLRLMRVN